MADSASAVAKVMASEGANSFVDNYKVPSELTVFVPKFDGTFSTW